jgi:hypothetical protein
MSVPADEAQRLESYIAGSRRVQRRLTFGLVIATLGAMVALIVDPTVGGLALFAVVIVAIAGFWVTAAHIADWKMQLARLRGPKPTVKDRPGWRR